MAIIQVKRVYEFPQKTDGFRVLIDRLRPRGLTEAALHADAWMKELAPSPCLRIWLKQHPEKWESFRHSYLIELQLYSNTSALLNFCKKHKKITLLYASRDTSHNHAVLLRDYLRCLQRGLRGYSILQKLV